MKNISVALIETIKDEKFQELIVDLSETTLDSILKDGMLKDFPIIGSIFGLGKFVLSIQDKLFTKKLFSFLLQLENTTNKSRNEQIEKIENDPNYKTKVGEKLLYIINKCEDDEKAKYLGKLFQCFIGNKINYDDFLRASRCVDLIYLGDLKIFINKKLQCLGLDEGGSFLGSGLMEVTYSPGVPTHGVNTSTMKLKLTPIGKIIQDMLY